VVDVFDSSASDNVDGNFEDYVLVWKVRTTHPDWSNLLIAALYLEGINGDAVMLSLSGKPFSINSLQGIKFALSPQTTTQPQQLKTIFGLQLFAKIVLRGLIGTTQ
jgi:hypothetical protein